MKSYGSTLPQHSCSDLFKICLQNCLESLPGTDCLFHWSLWPHPQHSRPKISKRLTDGHVRSTPPSTIWQSRLKDMQETKANTNISYKNYLKYLTILQIINVLLQKIKFQKQSEFSEGKKSILFSNTCLQINIWYKFIYTPELFFSSTSHKKSMTRNSLFFQWNSNLILDANIIQYPHFALRIFYIWIPCGALQCSGH